MEEQMGRYRVWCPDLGQEQNDGQACSAIDPRTAAEEWGEWCDRTSAEYSIVAGNDSKVLVLDLDSGETTEWIVSGESVPKYTARLVVALTKP
jgi:hypothetical protein